MSDLFGDLPSFQHSERSTEHMFVLAAELGIGIEELRPLGESIGIMVLILLAEASKESTLSPSDPRVEVSVRPDNLSTSPVVRQTAQTLESFKAGLRNSRDQTE